MIQDILGVLYESNLEYKNLDPPPSSLNIGEFDIKKEKHLWRLHRVNGIPVACIKVETGREEYSVSYLSVVPRFRRRKIATTFLRYIEDDMVRKNKKQGWILLRNDLPINISFFEKQGYKFQFPTPGGMYLYYLKCL